MPIYLSYADLRSAVKVTESRTLTSVSRAIRDNALYADSYIDLVTLDISDMDNIYEVSRVEDVFPYNSRQNIPDNVRLSGNIDRSRGVVVGYQ